MHFRSFALRCGSIRLTHDFELFLTCILLRRAGCPKLALMLGPELTFVVVRVWLALVRVRGGREAIGGRPIDAKLSRVKAVVVLRLTPTPST